MGTCFGRCINDKNKKKLFRSPRSMYSREADNVEFDFLVDENSSRESRPSTGISYLLAFKRKKKIPRDVTLELTDDSWGRSNTTPRIQSSAATRFQSNRLEEPLPPVSQFQPLDARTLLARGLLMSSRQRSSTSTPASSLDLEWEHEGGLPMHPLHYATEEETYESNPTPQPTPTPSRTAWSRVSSPDSLEWDPVEAPLGGEGLDPETEQLLTEIERLTSRALRETGDWTS